MGKLKSFKSSRGFTLIELMIAMAIFMLVLTAAVSIFLTSLKAQRRDFLIQNLQDNARYIMETIIKEARMSVILNSSGQSQSLKIVNQEGKIVTYQFSDSSNKVSRQELDDEEPENISSSKVRITGSFYIKNESDEQGRATIVMRLRPVGADEPEIEIQSTITSRAYIKMEVPGL